MGTVILLLRCPDRLGIVADVAAWVAQHRGNVVDAGQYSDPEHDLFLQRLEFETTTDAAELRADFAPVAERWSMDWQLHQRPRTARLALLVSKTAHCLYDVLGRCATGDLDARVALVVSNHDELAEATNRFGVPYHPVSYTHLTLPTILRV